MSEILYCKGCGSFVAYADKRVAVSCSAACKYLRGTISRQEARNRIIGYLYDVRQLPTTKLGEMFGMERSEVTRVLRQLGIPRRPPGQIPYGS
ncbi:hypothetical protein [Nonomuraea sp. SYSU D8015]|uniref:hypothetical protein n=1 Tax=Nonomuraea sp. SYSU D8015 TaxID=2593644 RepID=UPI001661052A|nr:hypothetical protein [Nonomuraea sp. SYSU D8015]